MAPHAGTPVSGSKLTYKDYVTLPDDNQRYEILDGDLAVSPSPRTRHQRISRNLLVLLDAWVTARKLGEMFAAPFDVILAETSVLVPDLIFVSNTRARFVTERGLEGAPDLVIEILSDSTEHQDRGAKKKLYARYGVERYWIIDPETRTLELYKRRGDVYDLTGTYRDAEVVRLDVPEGLELGLAEIWPEV